VFDTAPAYGAGEAERRLGRALATLQRDRLVICSKVGFGSHGLRGRSRDFSPDGVESSLRESLARLGVEGLDILFLHGADPSELTPASDDAPGRLASGWRFPEAWGGWPWRRAGRGASDRSFGGADGAGASVSV
jgi:aryl-alcohol dehydrogenase-like predicted oxidoreductase